MDSSTVMVIGLAVAAVGLFGFAVWQFIAPKNAAAERLAEFTGGPDRSEFPTRLSSLTRSAAALAAGNESDVATTRKWLVQGGFRSKSAPEVYSAARTLGLVGGALMGFLLVGLLGKLTTLTWAVSGVLLGATAGYYAPFLYVSNTLTKRKERILKAFPDGLDLLVSAVEAGLGIDSAFRRVADEMDIAAPELAFELQLVTHEVQGGIPRVEALRRLEERVGLEDLTSMVNVLIQAERFGSSVARSLRVHSEHIRIKRMQRAETKAAQVSPKLTIVMILFILPTLLIILLGPAAIQMKNILVPTAQSRGVM